jgi:hypothetical protein
MKKVGGRTLRTGNSFDRLLLLAVSAAPTQKRIWDYVEQLEQIVFCLYTLINHVSRLEVQMPVRSLHQFVDQKFVDNHKLQTVSFRAKYIKKLIFKKIIAQTTKIFSSMQIPIGSKQQNILPSNSRH